MKVHALAPMLLMGCMLASCDQVPIRDDVAIDPPPSPVSVLGSADSIRLIAAGSACAECIVLRPIVALGDDDGPGTLVGPPDLVALTASGLFVVPQGDQLKVFNLEGQYVGSLGKEGQGPGEFAFVNSAISDSAGYIHVFDNSNARHSWFDADLVYRGSTPLPGQVTGAISVPNEDAIILNMSLSTPEVLGEPLHKVSTRTLDIRSSFGLKKESISDVRRMKRVMAADQEGRIFATQMQSKEIEVWSSAGLFLGSLIRPGEVTAVPASALNPDATLPELTMGMSVDREGRLWVFTWVPRDNWQAELIPFTENDGTTAYRAREGNKSLYATLIEVIMPDEGLTVASQRFEAPLYRLVSDTLAIGVTYTPLGAPQLQVWDIDRTP